MFGYPDFARSDFGKVPVEVVFRMLSAYGGVSMDFAVLFNQLPPQASTAFSIIFLIALYCEF